MGTADSTHSAPPAIQRLGAGFFTKPEAANVQRVCAECDEEALVQKKSGPTNASAGVGQAPQLAKVSALGVGQPLSSEQRAFFEPRFGVDFSQVRIHADGSADTAARSVGALAYTRGRDIVFRANQFRPHAFAGRRLLAHELTHVVQQGAAPAIRRSAAETGATLHRGGDVGMVAAHDVLQRFPGDGMVPPGDCGWAKYLALRGSVESAKAIVSTLGACGAGDSCLLLATKIAAITAEIAARVALDATCFRGGDTGHRQQVQDKVGMLNRCHRFFTASRCSPDLIAPMAAAVEAARAVVTAAAIAAALVALAALIAAIILLVKAILAAAAAAAAATAEAAAAAAVLALLALLLEQISPEAPPTS